MKWPRWLLGEELYADDDRALVQEQGTILRRLMWMGASAAFLAMTIQWSLGLITPLFKIMAPVLIVGYVLTSLSATRSRSGYWFSAFAAYTLSVSYFVVTYWYAVFVAPQINTRVIHIIMIWETLVYVYAFGFLASYAKAFSALFYLLTAGITGWTVAFGNLDSLGNDKKALYTVLASVMVAHPLFIVALGHVGALRRRINVARDDVVAEKLAVLAMVGHEIRTALQPMLTSVDLLEIKGAREGAEGRAIARIRNATGYLDRHIRDLTEVIKIESGLAPPVSRPFDFDVAIVEVIDEARAAGKKRLVAIKHLGDRVGTVMGDSMRVRQILTNLLSNAIKYAGQSVIEVRAERIESTALVRLTVSDKGPGIPIEMQERIFEPFVRSVPPEAKGVEGTGLGLSVVRRLVKAMSGTVSLRSAPGQGATFTVELPLPPTAEMPEEGSTHQQFHVLVVDDASDIVESVCDLLIDGLGVAATGAANGEEALELMDRKAFDLVLTDLQMPGIDGHELARRTSGTAFNAKTPVVAMSAREPDPDHASAFADYLPKPVSKDILARLVAAHSRVLSYR